VVRRRQPHARTGQSVIPTPAHSWPGSVTSHLMVCCWHVMSPYVLDGTPVWQAVKDMDIVITTALIPGKPAPRMVWPVLRIADKQRKAPRSLVDRPRHTHACSPPTGDQGDGGEHAPRLSDRGPRRRHRRKRASPHKQIDTLSCHGLSAQLTAPFVCVLRVRVQVETTVKDKVIVTPNGVTCIGSVHATPHTHHAPPQLRNTSPP
jgi:hypothetical protein